MAAAAASSVAVAVDGDGDSMETAPSVASGGVEEGDEDGAAAGFVSCVSTGCADCAGCEGGSAAVSLVGGCARSFAAACCGAACSDGDDGLDCGTAGACVVSAACPSCCGWIATGLDWGTATPSDVSSVAGDVGDCDGDGIILGSSSYAIVTQPTPCGKVEHMPFHTSILLDTNQQNSTAAVTRYLQSQASLQLQCLEAQYVTQLNTPQEALTIDAVRQLTTSLSYAKRDDRTEVFIIHRIEQASAPAQHALLKALEEPPAASLIILTTDNPRAVLDTIRSRCELIRLQELAGEQTGEPEQDTVTLLDDISQSSFQSLIERAKETDRGDASAALQSLSRAVQTRLETAPTPSLTAIATKLQSLQERLQHNTNHKLVLERAYFTIKRAL